MTRLYIQVTHVAKSFGSTPLFHDISLSINQGDCFALIGENGSGKTTLLRLLAGFVAPDEGVIQRSSGLTVGFLPQEIEIPSSCMTVRHYLENEVLAELEKKMEECVADPSRLMEWEAWHEEYEQLGGYRTICLEKVLQKLHLEAALDVPFSSLSSGERVRVALAKALLDDPDLLLLDEPTNHLDRDMLLWLQEMLASRKGSTVLVSHDRKFLNETCNHLMELQKGTLRCYGGGYDFYLKEKEFLLDRAVHAFETQKKEKEQLKQTIRALSFSKPKPPPPSDRNIMAYDRRGEQHQKSMKRTLDTLKDRLEEIENSPLHNPKPCTIKGLHFLPEPLTTSTALEIESVSKSFDEKVLFSNFSRILERGERVILKGPNGSGKTTLLRCLMRILPIDSGSIRYGAGVHIAYLDQECEFLPHAETPRGYFERRFHLHEKEIRSELHKAALGGGEFLHRPFGSMSVGQRKRLMLLSLILERPNILLLDEPTNHLDLMTLEALEQALLQFEGALIAVSHDTTFIEKIATKEWVL